MRYLYLILIIFLLNQPVVAQQNPLFTQYMFNHLVLNPAYAGTKPFMSLTGIVRKQWFGMEGSPTTGSVSFHGPLKNRKMGLGLVLNNDHIGITSQTDLYANYSYQLKMGDGKLSLGLSAGFSAFKSNINELTYWDGNDPVYAENSASSILPNCGFGAYYFTEKFYAGISTPQLLDYTSSNHLFVNKEFISHPTPHYYLTSGIVIETSDAIKLKPSFLIRYVKTAPVSFDINLNVLINDILWLGVSYRHKDAIAAILEYQISRKLRFGYSYDYTITDFNTVAGTTHEVMISFDFGYDIMKIKNPRYF